jgi:hypothetical protein
MKISGLWLNLLLASFVCARAQVTVEVTQEQQQFLAGEALKVAVRITNLSGQELHLGAEDDWLEFSVESRDGMVVPKIGEAPVVGAFTLESSKVAIKRVDLAPYFQLIQPGNYQVVATVRIREWNRDLVSPAKIFDVIQGMTLWEQDVGIPKANESPESQPEIRRYILQQANNSRGRIRLYLRITDAYNKTLRVLPIGPMVSFGKPESQVDKLNNLHVLCQEGPNSYNYTVCNLQGDVITHQTYEYSNSRPRLRPGDDGSISVSGGNRRVAANDVPPPKQEDLSEDTPLQAPDSKSAPAANPPALAKPSH